MKKNKFVVRIFCLSFIFLNIHSNLNSEIMIMSKCKSLKDSFIKNEYILDFEKSLKKKIQSKDLFIKIKI